MWLGQFLQECSKYLAEMTSALFHEKSSKSLSKENQQDSWSQVLEPISWHCLTATTTGHAHHIYKD